MPFVVVGDGGPEAFPSLIDVLVEAGADALELGLPTARPAADGPAIARAHGRALSAGTSAAAAWRLIADVRARHADLPLCVQGYADAVAAMGGTRAFLQACRAADVDAVLILDEGGRPASSLVQAAGREGPAPVVVVAPDGAGPSLPASAAFVYLISRPGPTGADIPMEPPNPARVAALRRRLGLPVLLGFGISRPDHVRAARAAGVDGVIVGSSLAQKIEAGATACDHGRDSLAAWARAMKQATRCPAVTGV